MATFAYRMLHGGLEGCIFIGYFNGRSGLNSEEYHKNGHGKKLIPYKVLAIFPNSKDRQTPCMRVDLYNPQGKNKIGEIECLTIGEHMNDHEFSPS